MKRKYLSLILAMALLSQFFVGTAGASSAYAQWNGSWVGLQANGYCDPYAYILDFDALTANWHQYQEGYSGKGWKLTKVSDTVFTFQPNALFTLTLNSNGTITLQIKLGTDTSVETLYKGSTPSDIHLPRAAGPYDSWTSYWREINGGVKSPEAFFFDFKTMQAELYQTAEEKLIFMYADMTKTSDSTFTFQGKANYTVPDAADYAKYNDNNTLYEATLCSDGKIKLKATYWGRTTEHVLSRDNELYERMTSSSSSQQKDNSVLPAFSKPAASYSDGTFSDVVSGSWYGSSVKCVYECGVMGGTGKGFEPDGSVTNAQAITVAARIRAKYSGGAVSAANGAWYQKYVDYARKNGLLSDQIAASLNMDAPSTREFMAYLFSHTIDQSDLPLVNTGASIPDEEAVSADYKDAVKTMYAAGIMSGQDDGSFHPQDNATRAQMAAILTRLLRPAERNTSDPRLDPVFRANESNAMNNAVVAERDSENYLAFTYHDGSSQAFERHNGSTETFACPRGTNLFVSGDNYYYCIPQYSSDDKFQTESLYRRPVKGGQAQLLYTSSGDYGFIEAVTEYDGAVYFLLTVKEDTSSGSFDLLTSLCKIGTNGQTEVLLTLDGTANRLVGFNGKLYFGLIEIYAYDLTTKKCSALGGICGDWIVDGGTIYYVESISGELNKALLEMPSCIESFCVMPEKAGDAALNYRDGKLYVFPNNCVKAYGPLYTGSETGLQQVCDMGWKSVHCLGVFSFGYTYQILSDSFLSNVSDGCIWTANSKWQVPDSLYEYFSSRN